MWFGLICVPYVVGYPSGQRGQTVNLLAMPSMVRIHHLPPLFLYKGKVAFSQINQRFSPYPVFESLRFCAFTVSCVPVQTDAQKSITSQSMPENQNLSLAMRNARPASNAAQGGQRKIEFLGRTTISKSYQGGQSKRVLHSVAVAFVPGYRWQPGAGHHSGTACHGQRARLSASTNGPRPCSVPAKGCVLAGGEGGRGGVARGSRGGLT